MTSDPTATPARAPLPTTFAPPASMGARWEIVVQGQRPGRETRACAAALGSSWPEYRLRHPYTGDVLEYGGAVVDRLLSAGYKYDEITTAAIAAFAAVRASLVEVEGASGFSEPPAGVGSESGGG